MLIERTYRRMACLQLQLTPHEAKQLWAAINADMNSVARTVDQACHEFFKAHGVKE
jgi:hypothetical protein